MQINDTVRFREGSKYEGEYGTILSVSQTGGLNVRRRNGTICGAHPEELELVDNTTEGIVGEDHEEHTDQSYNNMKLSEEFNELFHDKRFILGLLITFVAVSIALYFNHHSNKNPQDIVDEKVQQINYLELQNAEEMKLQRDLNAKIHDYASQRDSSISRVKKNDSQKNSLRNEIYKIIK